jgi:ADP-ribose pyrophosphatase YjhB (NUDIX family)
MDKFCKFCGVEHTATEYPKTCRACEQITWINPTPVAVIGLRVRDTNGRVGILIGERGIQPQKGRMALISGFVDPHDASIEHAAVRELREETGIVISHEDVEMVSSFNTGKNMLVFCRSKIVVDIHDVLSQFKANYECPRIDIAWTAQELAFEAHTKMLGVFTNDQEVPVALSAA